MNPEILALLEQENYGRIQRGEPPIEVPATDDPLQFATQLYFSSPQLALQIAAQAGIPQETLVQNVTTTNTQNQIDRRAGWNPLVKTINATTEDFTENPLAFAAKLGALGTGLSFLGGAGAAGTGGSAATAAPAASASSGAFTAAAPTTGVLSSSAAAPTVAAPGFGSSAFAGTGGSLGSGIVPSAAIPAGAATPGIVSGAGAAGAASSAMPPTGTWWEQILGNLGGGKDAGALNNIFAGVQGAAALSSLFGGNALSDAFGLTDTTRNPEAILGLLREQAAPFEQKAFNRINNNLFTRGRLGLEDSETGEAYAGFARGLSEADTSRQLAAHGFSDQLKTSAWQRGEGLGNVNPMVEFFNQIFRSR